jgi:hypothetical protein
LSEFRVSLPDISLARPSDDRMRAMIFDISDHDVLEEVCVRAEQDAAAANRDECARQTESWLCVLAVCMRVAEGCWLWFSRGA